jgi:hypothetical protein
MEQTPASNKEALIQTKPQYEQNTLQNYTHLLPFDTIQTAQEMTPVNLCCCSDVFTKLLPSYYKGTHSPVQSSKFLLVLATTVILDFVPHGTHDCILLSDGSGSLQTNSVVHRQTHRLSPLIQHGP